LSVNRPTRFAACLFAVVLTALATVSLAQSNRWADPYQKGLKAFNAKDYRAAIALLEQAVAADPRSSANKHVEGVFYTAYFPYYYLGVAHLELRQYDKAKEYFDKARSGLTRPLVIKLDEYERRLTSELQVARGAGPLRSDLQPSNTVFEQTVRTADAALAARRYGDAVAAFDAARTADPVEYARRNVQLRRDEAARGMAGQQLANDGQQLLERSQLSAARTKFQQADQALPGQSLVTNGLTEIRRREQLYQQLTAGAEQDVRNNNLRLALDKYSQARAADPDQFAVDDIEARIRSVNDRLKAVANASRPAAPPPATVPAPAPDSGRTPDNNGGRPAGPDVVTLRNALAVLLQGDAQKSIAILEPALAGRTAATDPSSAALHAYLGVAYATEALSSTRQDEAARLLREKALSEFRLAVSAQRDYRLSPRVVSPKIVELFEQVRSN
jgi:tetratricopeptide (TPR) repeat protein